MPPFPMEQPGRKSAIQRAGITLQGGRFAAFQIESGDDMFRMLPELLASPCGEDALSAADHFTEADMDKNFACFIYVAFPGTDAEKETERLSQYGKVIIYTAENSR